MTRIVGISGHVSVPSRTLWLTQLLVDRIALETGADIQIHSVIDDPADLGRTLDRKQASPRLESVLRDIETCDLLVAVTPVYKGSYAGLFKHLIDLIDMKALTGRPVVVAATGYAERHAGVIDHLMRPLFAFFGAEVMVSGIYAGKADIDEEHQMSPTLEAAVDAAVQQAVRALGRAPS